MLVGLVATEQENQRDPEVRDIFSWLSFASLHVFPVFLFTVTNT